MGKLTMSRRTFVKVAAVTSAAGAVAGASPGLAAAETPADASGEVKRIRTGCRGCGKMECGVIAVVQDGRVVRVEGDPTAFQSMGNCCTKSQSINRYFYCHD